MQSVSHLCSIGFAALGPCCCAEARHPAALVPLLIWRHLLHSSCTRHTCRRRCQRSMRSQSGSLAFEGLQSFARRLAQATQTWQVGDICCPAATQGAGSSASGGRQGWPGRPAQKWQLHQALSAPMTRPLLANSAATSDSGVPIPQQPLPGMTCHDGQRSVRPSFPCALQFQTIYR